MFVLINHDIGTLCNNAVKAADRYAELLAQVCFCQAVQASGSFVLPENHKQPFPYRQKKSFCPTQTTGVKLLAQARNTVTSSFPSLFRPRLNPKKPLTRVTASALSGKSSMLSVLMTTVSMQRSTRSISTRPNLKTLL